MFINKLNEIGPAMEPWGSPACNFFAELRLLFICTDCFLYFCFLNIRSNALIENPYAFNFARNKS